MQLWQGGVSTLIYLTIDIMVDLNIPTVKSFLFCVSLRNGVKILGWIFLIGHSMAIFETPLMNLHTYRNCHLIPLYTDPDTGSHTCPEWLKLELLVLVLLDFSLSIAQITIAFFLLLGVYQKKPRLILQWVVLQLAMLILDFLLTNLSSIRNDQRYTPIDLYIFYAIWKSLETYGIYICYCYYISVISDPAQTV